MKKIHYLLFATHLLINCSGSGNENSIEGDEPEPTYCSCHDLILDEQYNHFYLNERRKGFTGTCEEFYANGEIKLNKSFVNGKVHGKMFSYYDNGAIHEEKEFDMNFQTGEQITFTKKGEVKFHALYKRGNQTKVLVTRPDLQLEDEWYKAE